jgi:hypothetical protein
LFGIEELGDFESGRGLGSEYSEVPKVPPVPATFLVGKVGKLSAEGG